LAELSVAVNVSAIQFRQTDFVDQILGILTRTGANPKRLKLELTESLLVDDVEDIITKMTTLKAMGVGFSLDDFGTGYSSLAYLSRLPLDQLKIDQSFVQDIESSDNAVAICAATISLAHSLKMKVVAEGVETKAQQYFLGTVHRCDLMQGYLFCRPVPVTEFERLASKLIIGSSKTET
jgi:EAL domain-containing protein (putative c-di-GMP-specific phosphodiesterase class I)